MKRSRGAAMLAASKAQSSTGAAAVRKGNAAKSKISHDGKDVVEVDLASKLKRGRQADAPAKRPKSLEIQEIKVKDAMDVVEDSESNKGKGKSPTKIPRPEPTPLELQRSDLLHSFRCLEMAINKLGKKASVWENVREYVQQLSKIKFDENILGLIITIWENAYNISWRNISIDSLNPMQLYLCIEIPKTSTSISVSGHQDSVSILANKNGNGSGNATTTQRIDIFDSMLTATIDGFIAAHSKDSSNNNNHDNGTENMMNMNILQPDMSRLPTKPISIVSSKTQNKSNKNKNTKADIDTSTSTIASDITTIGIGTGTLNASNKKQKKLARVSLLQNINKLKEDASANTITNANGNANANANDNNKDNTTMSVNMNINMNMDDLRRITEENEKQHKELSILQTNSEKMTLALTRIRSLPFICDGLRSYILLKSHSNRSGSSSSSSSSSNTQYYYDNILQEISPTFGITNLEMVKRIDMICKILPEYLTIFPEDDIITEPTIKINLNLKYSEIRNKIVKYASDSEMKIYEKYNNNNNNNNENNR
jgi:hypothetical protein